MVMPRSRGAVSGLLLVLAGLWAGLVPFFGPYLNLSVGSDATWDYTGIKLRLSILPAIAIVLGGLLVLTAANRAVASLGGWIALAGGVWLVVGGAISVLYNDGRSEAGRALGSNGERVLSQLTWYQGIGALAIALAAFALGRMALRAVGDVELARERDRDAVVARDRGVTRDEPAVARDRAPVDAAGEPVPAHDAAPVTARDEPVVARDPAPAATRDDAVAARPVAGGEGSGRRGGLLGRLRR